MSPRTDPVQSRDGALLPRVAGGDPTAVEECLDRYGPLVWAIVRKTLRDHAQAEDAVQEIFISLWKAAGRFDPSLGSESLFVTTVARRRLIDGLRSRSRRPEAEPIDHASEAEVAGPDPGLTRVELDDEAVPVHQALQRLKPEQKRLLEMWAVGGMTHREIATSTGIPLGTVKSQIRRGLLRARELLGGAGRAHLTEVTA